MNFTLNCKGRLLYIDQPIVMGILNATPDSFYTKEKYFSQEGILSTAAQMIQDGATIIDIGGMSTRPGAEMISEAAELNRVVPVIAAIKRDFPEVYISIDTFRAGVAEAAVAAGADIINDISAGSMNAELLSTVAKLNVPYILMHMQGTPTDMQQSPEYDDVVKTVFDFMKEKITYCRSLAIKDVILDPGFGFGKTIMHNYQLLKGMHLLNIFEMPVLAGVSRKSMLYKFLDITAEESLNATTVAHTLSLQQGAAILRAHDVKEAMQAIKIHTYYTNL